MSVDLFSQALRQYLVQTLCRAKEIAKVVKGTLFFWISKNNFLQFKLILCIIENTLMNGTERKKRLAFTSTRGRYASFGVVTSLPDDIVDSFWYIIDNF